MNQGGASRRHIQIAVEDSLRRLKTDRIDVYFLHHYDADTPIEESLRALDDLARQGKILYPAVSNWSAWQVMKGQGIARQCGLARIECLQPMYNLVKRQAEVEILPMAAEEKSASSPTARWAAACSRANMVPKPSPTPAVSSKTRCIRSAMASATIIRPPLTLRFTPVNAGLHPATLAVAWVMAHPAITAPIIGARNLAQLEASLAALDVAMTPRVVRRDFGAFRDAAAGA